MITNYLRIPNTTATIDTSKWYKIRVSGLRGITVLLEWLADNRKKLSGGYMLDGNCILLQNAEDATFFKLTVQDYD